MCTTRMTVLLSQKVGFPNRSEPDNLCLKKRYKVLLMENQLMDNIKDIFIYIERKALCGTCLAVRQIVPVEL